MHHRVSTIDTMEIIINLSFILDNLSTKRIVNTIII